MSQDGLRSISSTLYGLEQREQDQTSVFVPKQRVGAALWVGHQAEDIAGVVDDPRDVVERAVGVGLRCDFAVFRTVTEDDLVPGLQLGERRLVSIVVAFTVGDREGQHLAWLAASGKGGVCILGAEGDVLAQKGKGSV